jgi:hypothetical protein
MLNSLNPSKNVSYGKCPTGELRASIIITSIKLPIEIFLVYTSSAYVTAISGE